MSENEKKNETVDEVQTEEEQEKDMEVVHASKSEVVAKPKDVEKRAKKATASNMTDEEKRKFIEDNVLGDFYD